jgi:hypothetical protein
MLNPMSFELLATDLVRRRLDEAAHEALLAQLPASPSTTSRFAAAARQLLAVELRALAYRLDPSFS